MKVITEGHKYELSNFENKEAEGQKIQFIEKVPETAVNTSLGRDYGQVYQTGNLLTVNDGTTNEEVLEMLIDRMNYLQGKFPCRENAIVITKLEESLMWLNKRTADRVKRNVEGKQLK